MSCLTTYVDAMEAEAEAFDTAYNACTTIECKREVCDAHVAAVNAIYTAYLNCDNNGMGDPE